MLEKLEVTNLAPGVTLAVLTTFISRYVDKVELADCWIEQDYYGHSRGFAQVVVVTRDKQRVIQTLCGLELEGQPIKVTECRYTRWG